MIEKNFNESELQAVAQALGDTSEGLTGSEIEYLLKSIPLNDPTPEMTKWKRLFNAFVERQNRSQNRRAIIEFIRRSMRPERFARDHSRFEALRENLNCALAFAGLVVDESGDVINTTKAQTISEAMRRAQELRGDLIARGVHPDVLRFCREELLVDNYFHAVLEATKSVAVKLREKTGLTIDGNDLITQSFLGASPFLTINEYKTESQKSEQKGFGNLLIGLFGMFRNPTAHEARILWAMSREDAEDLLSLASLAHRRLDKAILLRSPAIAL